MIDDCLPENPAFLYVRNSSLWAWVRKAWAFKFQLWIMSGPKDVSVLWVRHVPDPGLPLFILFSAKNAQFLWLTGITAYRPLSQSPVSHVHELEALALSKENKRHSKLIPLTARTDALSLGRAKPKQFWWNTIEVLGAWTSRPPNLWPKTLGATDTPLIMVTFNDKLKVQEERPHSRTTFTYGTLRETTLLQGKSKEQSSSSKLLASVSYLNQLFFPHFKVLQTINYCIVLSRV